MNKLEYIRLEVGTKFNIDEAIKKAFKIYNNTIHSIIKIEPEKAFKFKKKKQINKLIENVIKSQINKCNHNIPVLKGTKALLYDNFKLEKYLVKKRKNRKKGKYSIPIIIYDTIGGNKYKFKVSKEYDDLKKNIYYQCDYKLIKFCNEDAWEKILLHN